MKPIFRPDTDAPGITVIDPIQRRQFPIQTSTPVQPTSTGVDQFSFPIDNAAEIATNKLVLPHIVIAYVRSADGDVLTKVEDFAYEQLPKGDYLIELNAPIKIYLRMTSEATIATSADRMEFDFGAETRVRIGARSYHEQPGATVTTTADPRDVMAAFSTFGSALKTRSCERSLPSLRGHPPKIELDDRFHIPNEISRPETGVRIELPPELSMIYPSSTLAYYLGANIVPGDEPTLVTDDGFAHSLTHPERGFEGEIERVLKQTLFLDCITRTEGFYQIPLHERQMIESDLDFAFDELYERSLSEQIEAYLDVPFDTIKEHVPTWLLSTTVSEDVTNLEAIPYLVNNLSLISTKGEKRRKPSPETPEPIDSFFRGTKAKHRGQQQAHHSYVAPNRTDSLEHAWLGGGMPIGANKLIKQSFENKLGRSSSTGEIDITVVCNEQEMSPEYDGGNNLYGKRQELRFDIDVHRNLSVRELESVLTASTDFLHYIGHVKDGKFICHDGELDVGTIDDVGVETFLLNGCRSYEQGLELIESGSIGGIVTYSEIANKSAIQIGRTIARLLNRGFSLRSALTIARNRQIVGNQYIVVGDGSIEIAQSESGTPILCDVTTETDTDDEYDVQLITYPTVERGMGSIITPFIENIETYFLNGGSTPKLSVDRDTLVQFFRLEQIPVIVDGEFGWSTDIGLEKL
ncbi:hypothetical protein [Haladaptatus caseinilyticus]|uniref:hypothetical protein n=1 Tax=Haladaptatus caseinilyticus TaxID=2993314 RepID=UPI00224B392B|nr:hypothetical protein [Haladaptatus caseinilyticus]